MTRALAIWVDVGGEFCAGKRKAKGGGGNGAGDISGPFCAGALARKEVLKNTNNTEPKKTIQNKGNRHKY